MFRLIIPEHCREFPKTIYLFNKQLPVFLKNQSYELELRTLLPQLSNDIITLFGLFWSLDLMTYQPLWVI